MTEEEKRSKWRAAAKKQYEKNPDRWRNRNYQQLYGITLEEYNSMLEKQGGVCAVCRQIETSVHKSGKVRSLVVDHCHRTGKLRSLICLNCNLALGHVNDDVGRLRALIEYLTRHNGV